MSSTPAPKWLILASLCAGYAFYTMTRRLLTVATPNMVAENFLTKTQIGLLSSYFSLGYGISRLVASVLSDFVSCRTLFCGGLAMTSVAIAAFGSVDHFVMLSVCWCLCGVCQGVGWPAFSRLLVDTFAASGSSGDAPLGLLWSLASLSGNVGTIAAPVLLLPLISFGWKMSFVASGVAGMAFSLMLWLLLVPSSTAKQTPTASSSSSSSSSSSAAATAPNAYHWVLSPQFLCLNLINIFAYFVSKSLSDWSGLYIVECLGAPVHVASMLSMAGEIGGAVGTVLSGVLCDALGGAVNMAGLVISLLALPAAALHYTAHSTECIPLDMTYNAPLMIAIFLFAFAASAAGPKNLVGLAVRSAVPEAAIGTASGVVGLTSQIGSAMAGVTVAHALEVFGWASFMPMLFSGAALLSISLLIAYRLARGGSAVGIDKLRKKEE